MSNSVPQNRESFTELVSEHQGSLRTHVRSLGGDDIWVDDLAQEVFRAAFRRQADFWANADYGKWLRGMVRHLAANERRKMARRSRLIHEALTDLLMAQAVASEEWESHFVLMTTVVKECVGQLTLPSRELLECRYAPAVR